MIRKLAAALLATIALAGCGGDDSDNAAATTTPPPATMTIEEASVQFLDLVAPVSCANAQLQEVNDEVTGGDFENRWEELLPPLQELSDAGREFAIGLRESEWPPELEEDIEELADSATAYSLTIAEAASAESAEELFDTTTDPSFASTLDDAAVVSDGVRQQLGLPPASEVDDSEQCPAG